MCTIGILGNQDRIEQFQLGILEQQSKRKKIIQTRPSDEISYVINAGQGD